MYAAGAADLVERTIPHDAYLCTVQCLIMPSAISSETQTASTFSTRCITACCLFSLPTAQQKCSMAYSSTLFSSGQ